MLEAAIAAEWRAADIPGGTVAAVHRDGRMDAVAGGPADGRAGRRATPDAAYHLFFGTKLYTATAVLQLVEQGRVTLDAPAATYLPDVLGGRRATARHLLNHTSGLRDTLRAVLSVHPAGAAGRAQGAARVPVCAYGAHGCSPSRSCMLYAMRWAMARIRSALGPAWRASTVRSRVASHRAKCAGVSPGMARCGAKAFPS